MSRSTGCDGHRAASTHDSRRGTGNTATPSGTGRGAHSASASRSGCGTRSIQPRWREPGRSSSAGTTSPPSGQRTGNRSGPCFWVRVRRAGSLVTVDVAGDAFLRGMVRRMMAVLLEVGRGTMDDAAVAAALGAGRPALDGAMAPAKGLTLRRVVMGRPDRRIERRTRRPMNAKTYTLRESEIERRWYVVDATGQTLGRLATRVARVLEGKHKPTYTPNLDSGDHVIVLNAAQITVTRDKLETKIYARHSGHPAGLQGGDARSPPRPPAGGGHPPRGQGHAAPQPPRRPAAPQAEDLRRVRPPAPGPAAGTAGLTRSHTV